MAVPSVLVSPFSKATFLLFMFYVLGEVIAHKHKTLKSSRTMRKLSLRQKSQTRRSMSSGPAVIRETINEPKMADTVSKKKVNKKEGEHHKKHKKNKSPIKKQSNAVESIDIDAEKDIPDVPTENPVKNGPSEDVDWNLLDE